MVGVLLNPTGMGTLHIAQVDGPTAEEIHEAPGGGDEHVHPAPQPGATPFVG